MGIIELIVLAVGLAMDAFAVSVCKGLAMKQISFKNASVCGVWFGFFQGIMPLIGYLAGISFSTYIVKYDHWIAFALLAAIGINMIREVFSEESGCEFCESVDSSLGFKVMLMMAIATSIDALAVGITFVCVPVSIFTSFGTHINTVAASLIIGTITFVISSVGVYIGGIVGLKYKKKAEIFGGIVLLILGIKILVEHLASNI
ncbi:MAG: manganese efflux pump [Lachnospiraceae bacterium]|nr:manganese efflux pump [Lachnospiraceae bacterium]